MNCFFQQPINFEISAKVQSLKIAFLDATHSQLLLSQEKQKAEEEVFP